ncbi:hypothetical protein [Coleofasciculus sp. H7-2]|uniref:hypothetical protein n=1 Tax=Coleofasciculus sp. H7-2 TaxID=3351545 RepID=UPI00366ACD50
MHDLQKPVFYKKTGFFEEFGTINGSFNLSDRQALRAGWGEKSYRMIPVAAMLGRISLE